MRQIVDGFLEAYMYLFESSGGAQVGAQGESGEATVRRDLEFWGYDPLSLRLTRARGMVLALHAAEPDDEDGEGEAADGGSCGGRRGGVCGGGLGASSPSSNSPPPPSSSSSLGGVDRFKLRAGPFDACAYRAAVLLPIKQLGRCKELEGGKLRLFTYRQGFSGVSLAIENRTGRLQGSGGGSGGSHSAGFWRGQAVRFTLDCSGSVNVVSSRGELRRRLEVKPGETCLLLHLVPLEPHGHWSWATKYGATWLPPHEGNEAVSC